MMLELDCSDCLERIVPIEYPCHNCEDSVSRNAKMPIRVELTAHLIDPICITCCILRDLSITPDHHAAYTCSIRHLALARRCELDIHDSY